MTGLAVEDGSVWYAQLALSGAGVDVGVMSGSVMEP